MSDPFASHARGLESPASRHFAITPANGVDLATRPRVLKVLTAGTLCVRDGAGVIVSYPVVAGEILQISAVGVEASGTTASVVGWL